MNWSWRSFYSLQEEVMLRISISIVALALFCCAGCGKTTLLPRWLNGALFHGTTGTTSRSQSTRLSNSQYRITPKQMAASISWISFSSSSNDADSNKVAVSNCTATYDQTQPSLSQLSDCQFSVPEGTYQAVTLGYSVTFQTLFDDSAGITLIPPLQPDWWRLYRVAEQRPFQ